MPAINPTVMKYPRLKPWFRPALIAAMAPAPGEMLIAQEARKKVSQTESDMRNPCAERASLCSVRCPVRAGCIGSREDFQSTMKRAFCASCPCTAMNSLRIELFQRMPIFGAIHDDALVFLIERSQSVSAKEGEFFFREGDI